MNISNKSALLCVLFVSSFSISFCMEKDPTQNVPANNVTRHDSTSLQRDGNAPVQKKNRIDWDTNSFNSDAAPAWACPCMWPCIVSCLNQCYGEKDTDTNNDYQQHSK